MIILIILAVAIGVGIYLFVNNRQKNGKSFGNGGYYEPQKPNKTDQQELKK